jgi:hypothetical protein
MEDAVSMERTHLTPETLPRFFDRFHRLYDGMLLRIEVTWLTDGQRAAQLWVVVRDQECLCSSTLVLGVEGVSEWAVQDAGSAIVVLSSGLAVGWWQGAIWLSPQPYSTLMEGPEDFRRSVFYLAGCTAWWAVAVGQFPVWIGPGRTTGTSDVVRGGQV